MRSITGAVWGLCALAAAGCLDFGKAKSQCEQNGRCVPASDAGSSSDGGAVDGGDDGGELDGGPGDGGPAGEDGGFYGGLDAGVFVVGRVIKSYSNASARTVVGDAPPASLAAKHEVDAGVFEDLPLSLDGDGWFHFALPPGEDYYLQRNLGDWVVSSARVITLEQPLLGRADAARVTGRRSFPVSVQGSGMVTTGSTAQFFLECPHNGLQAFLVTSQTGAGYDGDALLFGADLPVIDVDAGDVLTVHELGTYTYSDGGVAYTAPVSGAQVRQTLDYDGGNILHPQFVTTPTVSTVLTFLGSDYSSMTSQVNPVATTNDANVVLTSGLPASTSYPLFGAPIVRVSPGFSDTTVPLTWAEPFAPGSTRMVVETYSYRIVAPTMPTAPLGVISRMEPLDQLKSEGPAVQLSPPREVRIDGVDPSAPGTSIPSQSPLFTWTPPSRGLPTHYVVALWQLVTNASGTDDLVPSGTFLTAHTQLRLPPGTFARNARYIFVVTAVAASAPLSPTSAPFSPSGSRFSADSVTTTVSVP